MARRSHSIQIASALGAIVIATSSSDTKLAQARALGATHTINYTTHPNWETEVLRLTGGKGVDLVVEVVGSATIGQSLRATKHFGVVAMVGFLAGSKKTDLTPEIIFGAKTIYGVMAFTKSMVEELCRLVEDKGLRPAVGMVCEWEDAKSGFVALSKQAVVGKIVIKVGGEE
jgi:NADPH:quinone reductase-like Zn-dependent oxidoreductase